MMIKKILLYFFIIFFFFLSFISSIVTYFFIHTSFQLALVPNEKQNAKKIEIYDDYGYWICNLIEKKHDPIYYKDIPSHLINAFISTEDTTFFSHCGISFSGIIRSLFINLYHRKLVQGGSTITQQLIKLTRGNLKKSFIRKLSEQFLALSLENHYSKEQILESYLNIAYFGKGIYGIKEAAFAFFNKQVNQLTISESALLAGIIQNPEKNCPLSHYEQALKRRNSVIFKMRRERYITEDESVSALKEPLILKPDYKFPEFLHIKNAVFLFLKEQKIDPFAQDLKVYTTFDSKIQLICHEQVKNFFKDVVDKRLDTGSLVVDYKTGKIKGLIASAYLSSKDEFNRALKALRQIGSTIKPLVYYYALLKGETENSIYSDLVDEEYSGWLPRNYSRKYYGEMSLKQAFITSNNVIPVKILLQYKLSDFLDLLKKTNLINPLDNKVFPSYGIGCIDSTPIQLSSYFSIFLNNGYVYEPYYIKKIVTGKNKTIYKQKSLVYSVLDPDICKTIKEWLKFSGDYLQKKLKRNQKDFYIKTGTSSEFKTCWSMSADNNYLISLYLGFDKPITLKHIRSLKHSTGLALNILDAINSKKT